MFTKFSEAIKRFFYVFFLGFIVGILMLHWWAVYKINRDVQGLVSVVGNHQQSLQNIVDFLNGKTQQGQQQ